MEPWRLGDRRVTLGMLMRVMGPLGQNRGVFVLSEMEFFPLQLKEGHGYLNNVPHSLLQSGRAWEAKEIEELLSQSDMLW